MTKPFSLSKRILFGAFLPLALIVVLFVGAYYVINQQLAAQKISDYSWQFDELKNGSLRFKHIDFSFNKQLHVHLENIQISPKDSTTKNDTFAFLSLNKIEIGLVKITFLNTHNNQTDKNTKLSIKETIETLKNQLTTLQNQPNWLAFVPQNINIAAFNIQAPCSQNSCSVNGSANLNIVQTNTDIQADGQIVMHDKDMTEPQIKSQFSLKIPAATNQLQYKIESEVKSSKNKTNLIHFVQNGQVIKQQNLSVFTQLSGLLPGKNKEIDNGWQNLQKIYQNWTGSTLELDALSDYLPDNKTIETANNLNQQTNPSPLKNDFDITANSSIQLNSLKDINTNTDLPGLVNSLAFSNEVKAQFNSPFPIPSIGSVQGSIHASLAMNKGVIQSYDLYAKGLFNRKLAIDLLDNPKSNQLNHFSFEATSSEHQNMTLDKLPTLPFTLVINSVDSKSLKSPTNKASATLKAEGLFTLHKTPELNINQGSLKLSNTHLILANQKFLKQLSADIRFSGKLNSSHIHLAVPKLQLSGSYNDKEQNLNLNSIQVKTNSLALNITKKDGISISDLLEKLQVSAPSINIKTNLSFKPKNKNPISIKNIDLALSNLNLTASSKTNNTKPLTAKYVLKTDRFEQHNLQPLSWTLRGKIQSDLANTLAAVKQVNIQGSISNKAGLVIFHNAFYKPNNLYVDWEVPNSYFLAGNPFQKTFKDWPKLLTIGSGQFKAKGNSQLKFSTLNDKTNLLNALFTKAEVIAQGVSGIYNETTLNQVDSQFNLNLKQGMLKVDAHQLNALQINHGLIVGPIKSSGSYEAHVNKLRQGKLKLTEFNTQIFDGQAWIDKKTFDLDQPIKSNIHLSKINLKTLLEQYPSADIHGSGSINGDLPFTVNLQKEPFFTLDKGQIIAQSPGGLIQYKAASPIKQTHQSMKLVFSVLEDFHYSILDSKVTYDKNKTLHLTLQLQGKNPNVENGRQVNFNIQLEEDLPALITTMQLSNQVSETIKNRIQNKLQQQ
ncbi:hypothetical protein JCM30760_10800 [Thiomicrorhabdus hydrogeniphila]